MKDLLKKFFHLPTWIVGPTLVTPFALLVILWVHSLTPATAFIILAFLVTVLFIVGGMMAVFGRF